MRNIIYVSCEFVVTGSAASIAIMEMCSALSRVGAKTLLMLPDVDLSDDDLFEYLCVGHRFPIFRVALPKWLREGIPGLQLWFSLMCAKEILRTQNDIVFTRLPFLFFILAVIFRRFVIFEVHNHRWSSRIREKLYRFLIKVSLNWGRGFAIAISHNLMAEWLIDGIMCLHSGVDLGKFKQQMTISDARNELNIPGNCPMVVYTGSLHAGKGIEVLLGAANRLPGVLFYIVGGPEDKIVEMFGIAVFNNVVFTGQVRPAVARVYQAAADILALPNTELDRSDGFHSPIKLFEYMASGRAIVASDIPAILEILKNNRNALIFKAGDEVGLADSIRSLVEEGDLAHCLGIIAREDVQRYSWENRAAQIVRTTERLFCKVGV